jgi:ribosomal protein S17E
MTTGNNMTQKLNNVDTLSHSRLYALNQQSLQQWNTADNTLSSLNNKISFVDLNAKKRNETQANSLIVKSLVQKNIEKIWISYQQSFPQAFANNKNLLRTTPKIRFVTSPEELKKIDPEANPKIRVAFTGSKQPNMIFIYLPGAVERLKEDGSNEIIAVTAHELMHNLTSAMGIRARNDTIFKNDLSQIITLRMDTHKGELTAFSVLDLLREGSADTLSIMTTKINTKNIRYKSYRDLSQELIKIVGINTYKKALIENDYDSYKTLIKAALRVKSKYDKLL